MPGLMMSTSSVTSGRCWEGAVITEAEMKPNTTTHRQTQLIIQLPNLALVRAKSMIRLVRRFYGGGDLFVKHEWQATCVFAVDGLPSLRSFY
jgi:hypothetical protein